MDNLDNSRGDLNHDGKLDPQDVAVLRRILQGNARLIEDLSPQQRALLDINHDGKLDYDDLIALCQKLLHEGHQDVAPITDKLNHLRDKYRTP